LRLWKNNFILISATDTVVKVFLVIFTVAVILYYIWALIVAKNAIKEIKDDQKKKILPNPWSCHLKTQMMDNKLEIKSSLEFNQ
jgi:hypothetical protein